MNGSRDQRLQAVSKRHEALAAKDHVGVLEAGERQANAVEPMAE